MPPVTPGPIAHLPGHNVAVRRRHLLAREETLDEDLLIASFLMRRLVTSGLRCVLETDARMTHYDPPRLGRALVIFGANGLCCGAVQTEPWPRSARLCFALAFPTVAVAHWLRAARQQLGRRHAFGSSVGRLVAAIPLALAWGVGEGIGSLLGRRRVERYGWLAEVKPVTAEMVAARGHWFG